MRRIDRRSLLTAAAAGMAALTGCQSAGDTPTAEPSPTETPTPPLSPGTQTPSPGTSTPDEWSPDPADLRDRARAFLRLLQDGEFETAHERFAPVAADQIPVDQLEGVWSQITDQYGSYLGVSGLENTESGGYQVVVGAARFERSELRVVVSFSREGVAGFRLVPGGQWSPPGYADQSAFAERELTLSTPVDCSLGATLTLPEGDGEVPGVVLVHGSGPNDRDETIGPNKLFKDLAWGLASRGVAVLRYDKRTAACEIDLANATIDDVVTTDALTAVERLRGVDRIPDEDVVVVGHSIGGTLAPRIAARDGNLAGVVMLAALARPVTDALLQQNRYLVERDGTVTEAEQAQLAEVERLVEQIRTGDIPDDEVLFLGGDEYWQTLQAYDPVATARELSLPRLVMQGERDYQVTVEGDFTRWQDALGDQDSVSFQRYEQLNHLFMPGEGPPGPEEYFQPNNAPERVVTDIADFVAEHT